MQEMMLSNKRELIKLELANELKKLQSIEDNQLFVKNLIRKKW